MALPGVLLAAESRLLSMSGPVEVRATREGAWLAAAPDAEIAEGGAVRTGPKGAAVIQMPNKTRVWLKENSNIELEQRQTLASRLALVFGRIKVRVPHLMRKEKFEVRTPAAVCAVRGTEFTMGTTEDGQMDLQVLFGEVKLKFMIPPDRGPSEFNIPQGQGLALTEKGKATKPELLTPKAEREALENWNPGLKPSERQQDLQQKENDRLQLKEFARATNAAEDTVKNFLNVVKESDLEAGRTLNDVHGNVVRVDQRLMRSDSRTLQFFNLVKRTSYADYSQASGGFRYNGGAMGTRLDMARMEFVFNTDLPQRIEEWPGFFDGSSVRAERSAFIFANKSQGDSDIFAIAELYKYDPARDELVNNIKVVDPSASVTNSNDRDVLVSGFTNAAGLNKIASGEIYDNGSGLLKNQDNSTTDLTGLVWSMKLTPAAGDTNYYEKVGDPLLYNFNADAYVIGNNASPSMANTIWYAKETYVIGNGGEVKRVEDFTSSGLDPFSVLKDAAGQSVMYVKKAASAPTSWDMQLNPDGTTRKDNQNAYAGIDNTASGDFHKTSTGANPYPNGTNIDLVFIPDLAVAAIQRMLPAITSLNK